MIDLSVPRRQSVLAIVFLALRIVRSLGIAQLVVLGFFLLRGAADGRLLALMVLGAAALAGAGTLSWWRSTFQLVDDELVVNKGVLRRDRLSVPVGRIQSLTIDQQLLHRITGLVKVTIDTAGSGNAEFTIDAIERNVAEELQRQTVAHATERVDDHPGDATVPPPPETVVFVHDAQRLIITALTSAPWGAIVVLAPLFALADQFGARVEDAAPSLDLGPFRWWWLPLIAVVVVFVGLALNAVQTFTQHWEFTLRANPTVLRRTSGLLSTTSRASSPTRVQVVASRQNPLQRMAAIRQIELSSIGDGDLVLIGCDDEQVEAVHAVLGTPSPAATAPSRRIDRAEVWLHVRNATILIAIGVAIGVWLVGAWMLAFFLLTGVVWAATARHVRTFRWSLDRHDHPLLVTTEHIVARTTRQAELHKANGVRVTQSLFERRRGLGRVHLETAAGTVSVGMIPIGTARAVRDVVLHAAETDHRPWM